MGLVLHPWSLPRNNMTLHLKLIIFNASIDVIKTLCFTQYFEYRTGWCIGQGAETKYLDTNTVSYTVSK